MRFLKPHFFSFLLFGLLISVSATAQSQLQSPEDFLGYELGSQWTPHHKVMDYFWHVAEQSEMVKAKKYGETNEGRELMLAYVSSTQNVERLDEIRKNNLKRTGLLEGKPKAGNTAIVWLSYNVHGNETSSSEAALKTIYELVRLDNPDTKEWLQNTVVVMDPMLNPDGRDRYVHWYKETVGDSFNAYGEAREHHEPWPGGRTNHYYFDLNRDWAWLTQKESRARVEEFQKWMPHIHVDFHEQGYTSPYYFAPAAEPFHKAITEWQRDFQYTIGENHAKYFNENSWLYFTREVFDLFYPSYGDTYPIFNGSIGMTYEQAGGGYAGLGIKKPVGDTLTLKDRLTHHHTTGLSTVEISSKNADKLVDNFADYFEEAQNNPEGKYKTFVIEKENNPDKLQALFSLLDKHKVEYGQAGQNENVSAYNYKTGQTRRVRVEKGDYLVSTYQPKGVLARILFEPRPELADSVTYDITAWSQYYAYGLDGYAVPEQLDVEAAPAPQKEINNTADEKAYAYLAEWKDLSDVGLLADLLKHDIKVRFSEKAFKIEGQDYAPGTLVITRSDNKNRGKDFERLVTELATKHNQQVDAVSTGFVQSGADFGSSSVRYLEKPRIALLSGEGTSSNRVGEVWHYFDKQINYPVTLVDTDYFSSVNLDNYEVLIMASGYYGSEIDSSQFDELRNWISEGGKLIALQGANSYLAGKDGFNIENKSDDGNGGDSPDSGTVLDEYGDQQRERISGFNSGSIFKISLDNSHPLAFGYDDHYFSLKLNADAYSYLEDGWNVGVAKGDARMSGFVGYKAKEKLRNTLTFGVQEMGSGSVVYMVDNPLFRAFWYNGKLLFGNAVFMVGQ
ncbi:M14 family metallopeptidase [Fodinibius halophilus]|uniref:Zinc carboxypeptidase n=1 Tax=Fodinibius halophilus TaxID=1736908 RepID=A0A6M1T8Q7_9BACT|nr:M14 family zinc carboxypeptidase [Fodinibius halophilus]NGP88953.1 zinc carboxypeptidase [Fodinibius halophilus]